MNNNVYDFEEYSSEEVKNIFRSLTNKSTRIQAALQLRYLKHKLTDYIDGYPVIN